MNDISSQRMCDISLQKNNYIGLKSSFTVITLKHSFELSMKKIVNSNDN